MIHKSTEPAHPTRVQLKREARKREILKAALELASAHRGMAGLTLVELAAAMSWRVGALYRYYPSREAIEVDLQRVILIMLRLSGQRACAQLSARAAHAPAPVRDLAQVAVLCLHYEAFSRTHATAFGILSTSLATPQAVFEDSLALKVASHSTRALMDVAGALEQASKTGALPAGNSSSQALLLFSGLHGLALTRKLTRFAPTPPSITALSADLVTGLLQGWGARPDDVREALALVSAPAPQANFDLDEALGLLEPGGL